MKASMSVSFWRGLQRSGSFFRKQPLDRELDAEMQSHLQMAVDENLRQGLSMQEARRQAMVRFGGVERTLSFYSCAASFADKSHGCAAE
jgi:hypothetical protein